MSLLAPDDYRYRRYLCRAYRSWLICDVETDLSEIPKPFFTVESTM